MESAVGKLPDARWFPNATLNYAEHLLRRRDAHIALVARSEDGSRRCLTYAELGEQDLGLRRHLLDLLARVDAVADDLSFSGSLSAPTFRVSSLDVA